MNRRDWLYCLSPLFALSITAFACSGRSTKPSEPAEGNAGAPAAGSGHQAGAGGADNTAGAGDTVVPKPNEPTPVQHSCTNPKLDPVTKLVNCAEGHAHRPEPTACDRPRADETGFGGAPVDLTTTGCADGCDSVPGSICIRSDDDLDDGWDCATSCVVDDDCPGSQICLCGELGGTCTGGDCRSDSDCGNDLLCSTVSLCGGTSFQCQQPQDECVSNEDCGYVPCNTDDPFEECGGMVCVDASDSGRYCSTIICG